MKKKILIINLLICIWLMGGAALMGAEDPKTLEIGAAAPAFSLPGIDGKTYTLDSFKAGKLLVDYFYGRPLSHCPGI